MKWKRRASLVSGMASGLPVLENRVCLAASTESVLCTSIPMFGGLEDVNKEY